MNEALEVHSREAFRAWLEENSQRSDGVWLLFYKKGNLKWIKASEALEEALCYGWIDGKMQRRDEETYVKYFAKRRKNSKWSEKNKALVRALEAQGVMTDCGRREVDEAKQNGQWDAAAPQPITEAEIAEVAQALKPYSLAHANFSAMSPSIKKTYTRAFFDAKTQQGCAKRLLWMVDRLNQNLKPM